MQHLLPERRMLGLAFLSGAVAGLGHVPVALPVFALAGFALIFWLAAQAVTPARAAWRFWAAGAGYFLVTLHWIVEPFFVDAARHGWMAPFALVFMCGGLALFWAAAGAVGHRLGRTPRRRIWAFVPAMVLTGFGRTYLFTGFPWALPGYVWSETPIAQAAMLGGVHGLSLITLTAAAVPAVALLERRCLPRFTSAILLPAAALTGLWAWGMGRPENPAPLTGTVARLVQPNAPQHLKWRPDMVPVFFGRALDFTAAPAVPPPDLVVWPETSVPAILPDADAAFGWMRDAAGAGPTLVAGLQRREGASYFNSLAVIPPGAARHSLIYDKHHLVPFGEYLPFSEWLGPLGLRGLAANLDGGFQAGPGPRVIDLPGGLRALPLICYEAVFPQDVFRVAARPDLLIHITNDAWFGRFSGPYQHLAQSRMRAIEQGLPMLRAANTGISAVIDPWGRVLAEIELGESGFLDSAVPAALPATPYALYRDWPVLVLVLLLLVWAAIRPRRGTEKEVAPGGSGG